MKRTRVIKSISRLLVGTTLFLAPFSVLAEDSSISEEVQNGMDLFQGKEGFENGGPSCISCHNVNNDDVAAGGLFAMDLTDYFDREGSLKDNVKDWLAAPAPPAMFSSYSNNPLTEDERIQLTAFLKYANEVKADQQESNGELLMLVGGGGGFAVLLVLIGILWRTRKKKMVKESIFMRQNSAVDAKF